MAGWEGSTRRARLPANWNNLRKAALRAADRECQIRAQGCTSVATEVDHVEAGDDHSLANLQAVCHQCHTAKTTSDNFHRRKRRMQLQKRPRESHPGQLFDLS